MLLKFQLSDLTYMDKFENFNNCWIPRLNKYKKVRASGDPCVQNYGLPVKSMEINLKKFNMYNMYNVQHMYVQYFISKLSTVSRINSKIQ